MPIGFPIVLPIVLPTNVGQDIPDPICECDLVRTSLTQFFLNFLLMHFLDYNNVGGVRWTSISELCIIEIYLLLAPHVNTINKYEVCEGRC